MGTIHDSIKSNYQIIDKNKEDISLMHARVEKNTYIMEEHGIQLHDLTEDKIGQKKYEKENKALISRIEKALYSCEDIARNQ